MDKYGNIWKYMEITSNHRLTTIGSFFININRLGFKTQVAIYSYFHFSLLAAVAFKERSSLFCIVRKSNRAQFRTCPLTKQNRRPFLRRIQISEEVKICFVIHISDFVLRSRNWVIEIFFLFRWLNTRLWYQAWWWGGLQTFRYRYDFDEYNCHKCDYNFEIYCCFKATHYERSFLFRKCKTWMWRLKTWMWRFTSRVPTTLR